MRLIKITALVGVIVVAGSVMSAQAQKVYVADNGTRSVNSGWNVKVFNNGAHAYIIGDNSGVTFSPRGVGVDSTGAIYVLHLSPQGPNIGSVDKYSENAEGTAAFKHSQEITTYGGIGLPGPCNWGSGDIRRVDVNLVDDTIYVADANGVWNTTCGGNNSSPGGRGPGSYAYVARYPTSGGTVIDSKHTHAINIQGLQWHNGPSQGARTQQNGDVHVDQSNGDVYVGSGWNAFDINASTQQIERFSANLVQLSAFDINAPGGAGHTSRTNALSDGGSIAVTPDGSIWFTSVLGGAGMGGWGNMGALVKHDSAGNHLLTRSGKTVISGSTRNHFQWAGGIDVDDNGDLWFASTDRIMKLNGVTGDLINYPYGDTAEQYDTNVYGEGAFASGNGALEQIVVGRLPPVGSSIRIQ